MAVVTEKFRGAITSLQIAVIRTKSNDFITEYLYYVLQSDYIRQQVSRRGTVGFIGSSISVKELRTIRIPKLSISDQHSVIERIKSIEKDYLDTSHRELLGQKIDSILKEFS